MIESQVGPVPVECLQVLPDGKILSGDFLGGIRVWREETTGEWKGKALTAKARGHKGGVNSLHALPDGRIVSGSSDRTIRIWAQDSKGKWASEVLKGFSKQVDVVQVLSDGRIIAGVHDNTIRIFDGTPVSAAAS